MKTSSVAASYIYVFILTIFWCFTSALAQTDVAAGTNVQSNPVCVAYAHLVEFRPFEQKVGYYMPPEASIDVGVYDITSVIHGSMVASRIYVPFAPTTLRGSLPTNAILIVTFWDGSTANYKPIGNEAWRGILPDTPENRVKIESMSLGELSETLSGRELPEAAARQVALNKIEELHDYTGFSRNYKFSASKRNPFGWFFSITVLDERNRIPVVNTIMVEIGDDGDVVYCRLDPFGALYTAAEWDSIPSVP